MEAVAEREVAVVRPRDVERVRRVELVRVAVGRGQYQQRLLAPPDGDPPTSMSAIATRPSNCTGGS